MKFGETFREYLHGEQEWFLHKVSHVEYKRLKKLLKSCSRCRSSVNNLNFEGENNHHDDDNRVSQFCASNSCPECDQRFFSELLKEASEIVGCFRSRVRRLQHLHDLSGFQGYLWHLCHCFGDQSAMIKESHMLIDYVLMNAIAIRKILKKYDKVHGSVNGRNFKSKMQARRIELLQSPWMIELGAFCLNCQNLDDADNLLKRFSCTLCDDLPAMTLTLPNSIKIEYHLTCAICLDTLFHPYALGCGHLFCKSCLCSAASVFIFEGPKIAPPGSKCPICRSVQVYEDSVHMPELDLLLKNSCCSLEPNKCCSRREVCWMCKDYWKDRLRNERALVVKQTKEFWDLQTRNVLGF